MAQRPNLILITTDQQRGDCLGCDGHPCVETPYIDELAEQGARFTNAYTAVPSCTPARACILTGMDQWNHGRLTMMGDDALEFPATLPGELAKAGYHTQAVGKMHFSPQRRLYGFHHLLLDESGRQFGRFFEDDYQRWFRREKEGDYGYRDHSLDWNSWMARPSHLPEHMHPSHWTADEGVRFLRQRDPTKPFFLWLSFARPHSPYDAPQPYFDMYNGNPDVPEAAIGDWCERFDKKVADVNAAYTHRSDREVHRARAGYYGNITFIDHQIGRVIYEMRRHQHEVWDNTFVIFTSDHGDMMGDHHHWRKTYAYEGSARVPFVMKFPRHWEHAREQVVDPVIELRDIMPTLLDAAGAEVPESVDGSSLLPLARGEEPTWREFIMGEHTESYFRGQASQYVTDGHEKYIWFHYTGEELFFNLDEDPLECRNLAQDRAYADRVGLWRERLARVNEERGDPRGKDGALVVQQEAIRLTDSYATWKARAEAINNDPDFTAQAYDGRLR
jgi:arylsulfatase A-like enzyme